VSPLLKSEVRLRVGPQRSQATLWRAGLRPQPVAYAEVLGHEDVLPQLLDALAAQGHALPAQARVCLEDEYLYYTLIGADVAWRSVQASALARFTAITGEDSLQVSTQLTPCGQSWLAVAVPGAQIEALREGLAGRDIALRQVSAALLDDLRDLDTRLPADSVVVALRSEGAMLLALAGGRVVDLSWQRCDLHTPAVLAGLLRGYLTRFGALATGWLEQAKVLLLPADETQAARFASLADSRRWQLLPVPGAPLLAATPSPVKP
jgi:hypothetical protein